MADLYSFLASKPSSVAFTTMSTNTIRATTSATPPGDEALACPSCGFIAGAEIALLFCSLLHAPSVWLRRGGDPCMSRGCSKFASTVAPPGHLPVLRTLSACFARFTTSGWES